MGRRPYSIEHYEGKLYHKYGTEYSIIPREEWHGVKTQVTIFCHQCNTIRKVYLQKLFNGRNSMVPCRGCYLKRLDSNNDT